MKFTTWYFADYLADTYELDLMEEGAYRRMIDFEYQTERPLPEEPERLFKALRVHTAAEKRAVEIVLKKYFRKPGGKQRGWVQPRVVKEIAKYNQFRARCVTGGINSHLSRRVPSGSSQPTLRYDLPNDLPNQDNPPSPLSPLKGGDHFVDIPRNGATIRVHLGKHKRLPNPNGATDGATNEAFAQYLTRKGYPARVLPKEQS